MKTSKHFPQKQSLDWYSSILIHQIRSGKFGKKTSVNPLIKNIVLKLNILFSARICYKKKKTAIGSR